MGSLSDMDRPVQRFHFAPWGREVAMRAPPAAPMVKLSAEWKEREESDDRQLKWFAKLLEICMVEPCASADEWIEEVQLQTLMELGTEVFERAGIDIEQKKSDAETTPSGPSVSNCAET